MEGSPLVAIAEAMCFWVSLACVIVTFVVLAAATTIGREAARQTWVQFSFSLKSFLLCALLQTIGPENVAGLGCISAVWFLCFGEWVLVTVGFFSGRSAPGR